MMPDRLHFECTCIQVCYGYYYICHTCSKVSEVLHYVC